MRLKLKKKQLYTNYNTPNSTLNYIVLTIFEESPYWIFRRSIARIIDCIAMKMFWYTSLINPLLSSSE